MVGRPSSVSARRRGFARRDSNLALLAALFTGIILALAVLLLVLQRVNPALGQQVRGAMVDALQPLLSVAHAPVAAARDIGDTIGAHWRLVDKNAALEAELAENRAAVARTRLLEQQVRELEALIGLRRPERRVVAATVAAAAPAVAARRTAIIGAGLKAGVRPRMPVIAADGLAGRVTEVGQNAARIMLLTDANSRVPVKVMRTGWTGLAIGTGGTLLEFSYDIASGSDRIRVGDRLVTSGDGGLYPPGIPVAVIIDARASPPRARALANPTGLGAVIVEASWLAPPEILPVSPAIPEADVPASAPAATP
ncbi:MAG: rod shape-determining protein MreC [Sphingomonadaceae bacterium]